MAEEKQTESKKERQAEFAIQRIYVKDISFEAPNTPAIFKEEWQPELKFNMQTSSQELEKDTYEVVISLTVTVNNKTKVAYLIEVKQGGIFTLKNFTKEQVQQILGSVCPSIIYPYTREVISDVAVRGSFPPLYLAPINFDALYAEQVKQKQKETESSGEAKQ